MRVKFFSARSYEKQYLINANHPNYEVQFEFEALSLQNTSLAKGFDAVSVFTNDDVSAKVLEKIYEEGVRYVAVRATGHDNVDLKKARELGIRVANVPLYSPYAVAEHTIALILCLNRKLIKSDQQVKQQNFTLDHLIGFDLNDKTVGIIGMGKIGQVVARILHGFGCHILACDPNPEKKNTYLYNVRYCSREEIFNKASIITLNCPLNNDTRYMINKDSLSMMREGVMLINCGRGPLLNTSDVLEALKTGKIGYLGMDVYEKEKGIFFFDHSGEELKDKMLKELMRHENVLITPHQAFLTNTALQNIADTTFYNIACWADEITCCNELHSTPPPHNNQYLAMTLKRKTSVSLLFLWAGLLIGISFLEAPLKFQAPGITLELGLGIGRLVFAALNKAELVLSLIILLCLVKVSGRQSIGIISFYIAFLVLLGQTFFLLPPLDARAVAIQNHEAVLPSSLHAVYIACEVAKLLLIVNSGILLQRDQTDPKK